MNVKRDNAISRKIAENITYISAVLGKRIYDVEKEIGRQRGYFSRVKAGNGVISADDCGKIAYFFGITVSDLTTDDYKHLYEKMQEDKRQRQGKAHWIIDDWLWTCSKCNETYHRNDARKYTFCPRCGAKLGGDNETVNR